jgi:hypothetical protein
VVASLLLSDVVAVMLSKMRSVVQNNQGYLLFNLGSNVWRNEMVSNCFDSSTLEISLRTAIGMPVLLQRSSCDCVIATK